MFCILAAEHIDSHQYNKRNQEQDDVKQQQIHT